MYSLPLHRSYDRKVLMSSFAILGIGIVMLYSSSADVARELTGDHTYFLKRQLVRVLLGTILLVACSIIDYRILKRFAKPAMVVTIIALLAALIIHEVRGASGVARWIPLGSISVQPSDFARLGIIIYLADYLDKKGEHIQDLMSGFVPPILIIGLIMILIVLAPDFSTAALTGLLAFTMLFIGGARIKHLAALGGIAAPMLLVVLLWEKYRRIRVLSFLGLIDSPAASYQNSQSLIGLGNGGFLGVGLGNSIEKRLFLPASHTDFVFAIIGEEWGFLGAVLLLAGFCYLAWRGVVIARNASDRFGMFLALGIVLNITIYVLVNTAVVTEIIPNTGVPLPLISYGGSHVVFTLTSLGILLNISKSHRREGWNTRLVHAQGR